MRQRGGVESIRWGTELMKKLGRERENSHVMGGEGYPVGHPSVFHASIHIVLNKRI